jgi:hypothetical protein
MKEFGKYRHTKKKVEIEYYWEECIKDQQYNLIVRMFGVNDVCFGYIFKGADANYKMWEYTDGNSLFRFDLEKGRWEGRDEAMIAVEKHIGLY